MNIDPESAYVYQPFPVTHGDKIYGVSGPNHLGFEEGPLKGLTRKDADEIARFCNEHKEFSKSFIGGLRARIEMPYKISECGCRFESLLTNAVELCEECESEHFRSHG